KAERHRIHASRISAASRGATTESPQQHGHRRIRRAPPMPAHRLAGAEYDAGGHCRPTIRPLGGEPVEQTTPERGERVGRGTTAESPTPQTGGGDDDDSAWGIAAGDDHASIVFTT